ncbi:aminoglycoside phosphotransferase (APT) family kinase protein [Psychromicrobium silvestre]|uniref:Aminoglycoside phosphotransferase (APT) family kinase protein n=1 Tax=Psychromicrobium silvestre TaxID=1645614 RepID=A0A7Y9S4K5_9MICC|nr:aminoglycoside phosphotransferase family protein [Psychromicrobium silvestre]NYE94473.1 aminoglycoside phosphotransferase (APT) family kinase protein [Psychromicrobium silvestre]
MANMPAAEVPLNEMLVTQLLHEQQPDLAHLPVHTLANGWDNGVFRLGKDFVVRLPRREISVQLIRNEQLFLPQIAELTSLNLPVPLRLGRPSETFGWPWTVSQWFDGEAAILSAPREHGGLVDQLADFLISIHRPAATGAPRNPVRGVPLRNRDRAFRDRVTPPRFAQHREIIALWEQSLRVPEWHREPYWLHGDLHAANILVLAGQVSAIIDFGDMGCGDPAVDFAAAWILFERSDRDRFRAKLDERIGTDAALWQRARGWALNLATVMLTQSDDSPEFLALGEHTLRAVLEN